MSEWDLRRVREQPGAPEPVIDVHLDPDRWRRAALEEARSGLTSSPKELSPKWLYDDRGSELFDRITRLPEYYPTRREREILTARADEIAILSRADSLVELGSGTSEKTRLLLDALTRRGELALFAPFDVSEQTLRQAAAEVSREYPGVAVHGVVGDFEHHLDRIPEDGRRLIAFLGGTIGNFKPEARRRFYAQLHAAMAPGDTLLLGTDLIKDPDRLFAAYNDSEGVTAEFNLNVLAMMNRELAANFDLGAFRHLAPFNREQSWIEMLLISEREQTVTIPALGLEVQFARGEPLRTEVSTKFEPATIEAELGGVGFAMDAFWTDDRGDYALSLWRR